MSPMNEALNGIFQFYIQFIEFIFNDMLLFDGISFGWVLISCLVFGFLIKSILVLPYSLEYKEDSRSGSHIITPDNTPQIESRSLTRR